MESHLQVGRMVGKDRRLRRERRREESFFGYWALAGWFWLWFWLWFWWSEMGEYCFGTRRLSEISSASGRKDDEE